MQATWQIEHENFINRGYVYSSRFIQDEQAAAELLLKNPKITTQPRVVKFRSGRYRRNWIENVIGIGNAAGFVEPLEATALQVICVEVSTLADALLDALCDTNSSMIKLYNRYNSAQWDDIRSFLAIHYKFNTRLNTPFWQACRQETALHEAEEIVEFYRDNGPSALAGVTLIHPSNSFRMDGFLALLVGQNVPYNQPWVPSAEERKIWRQHCERLAAEAHAGMSVKEALTAIRSRGVKLA